MRELFCLNTPPTRGLQFEIACSFPDLVQGQMLCKRMQSMHIRIERNLQRRSKILQALFSICIPRKSVCRVDQRAKLKLGYAWKKCTLYNFCIEGGRRCPIFSPVCDLRREGGLSGAHVVGEGGLLARGICCGRGFTDTSSWEWNKKPPAPFKTTNVSRVNCDFDCIMDCRRLEGLRTLKSRWGNKYEEV